MDIGGMDRRLICMYVQSTTMERMGGHATLVIHENTCSITTKRFNMLIRS